MRKSKVADQFAIALCLGQTKKAKTTTAAHIFLTLKLDPLELVTHTSLLVVDECRKPLGPTRL